MKSFRRIILQVLFWAFVWLIMALGHENMLVFLENNFMICVVQIAIITTITFTLAPKILSQKKISLFVTVGLISVLLCGLLAYQFSGPGPVRSLREGPPQNFQEAESNRPPPRLRENAPSDRIAPPPQRRGNLTSFGRFINSPILINFLLLCLTLVLASVVETFLFAKRKEEALILSKTETLETELKLLKSQINPHFLFNALNNIYALSALDAGKTQQSISYLSNMLRYVLYECERPFVPLQKEVDYIKDYIQLFVLKSSKVYPIETEFNSTNGSIKIAPMLLIPFVENAFKHSNIEAIEDVFIKIYIQTNEDSITFKVENTIPENRVAQDEVGGIGLENVKKRLDILYPEKHRLEISEGATFKVELNLKAHA